MIRSPPHPPWLKWLESPCSLAEVQNAHMTFASHSLSPSHSAVRALVHLPLPALQRALLRPVNSWLECAFIFLFDIFNTILKITFNLQLLWNNISLSLSYTRTVGTLLPIPLWLLRLPHRKPLVCSHTCESAFFVVLTSCGVFKIPHISDIIQVFVFLCLTYFP